MAGAPQVVIPQVYDQHYWAQRVQELGIGAAHAPGTPTAESLTPALEQTLRPNVTLQAQAIAAAVRRDGARDAAERAAAAACVAPSRPRSIREPSARCHLSFTSGYTKGVESVPPVHEGGIMDHSAGVGVLPTPKQQFLEAYDREHAITMRRLRAYPSDKLELRPHAKCKTARELAWIFVGERGLGTLVLKNALDPSALRGGPEPPANWADRPECDREVAPGFSRPHRLVLGGGSDAGREVLRRAQDDGR